jgi:hypothetical protein
LIPCKNNLPRYILLKVSESVQNRAGEYNKSIVDKKIEEGYYPHGSVVPSHDISFLMASGGGDTQLYQSMILKRCNGCTCDLSSYRNTFNSGNAYVGKN